MEVGELVRDETILKLLSREAADWWYHKQLRDCGQVKEARERERQIIKQHLQSMRDALLWGGWMDVFCDTYIFRPNHRSNMTSRDKKGMSDPLVQACIRAGITVVDFTHLGEEVHYEILRMPDPNPWRADKGKNWSTMSYCPLHYYIEQVEKLGAKVINKDAALNVEIFGPDVTK